MVALSQALAHLPAVVATAALVRKLEQGQRVSRAAFESGDPTGRAVPLEGRFQILRPDGALLAVAELRHEDKGPGENREASQDGEASQRNQDREAKDDEVGDQESERKGDGSQGAADATLRTLRVFN